jgi:hypothetical protein
MDKGARTVNPAGSPTLTPIAPEDDYSRNNEKTPFENFEGLATKLLRVPKEEVDQKRAEQEKARRRKQD